MATPLDNQPAAVASTVTIEELGPSGPGIKPRTVVLQGPSLPFMGAEWGFENNLITTWYPGNGVEGTQQNLGPRELPSIWEGEWKRTLMGKVPTKYIDEVGQDNKIASPHVLRDVLEDIFRGGVRLRVTWAIDGTIRDGAEKNPKRAESYKILREGLVKSFKTPFDRHTDIRWTIEFHWVSRGGQSVKVSTAKEKSDVESAANNVKASVNATNLAVSNVKKNASALTLGKLEQLAGTPSRLVSNFTNSINQDVDQLNRVGQVLDRIASQPQAIINSVTSVAHHTVSTVNSFGNEMSRIGLEQFSKKTKVSSVLRSKNYFSSVADAAILNARSGFELGQRLRQILVSGANRGTLNVRASSTTRGGDVLAVYITKSGDTPQNVSQKYYKGPDHGIDILRANRMPWFTPVFAPGTIIIIPALDGSSSKGL